MPATSDALEPAAPEPPGPDRRLQGLRAPAAWWFRPEMVQNSLRYS